MTNVDRRSWLKATTASAAAAALPLRASRLAAADPRGGEVVQFPRDFLFGVGTSAYQIEGAATADGKGESIWDRWTHIPERTKRNGDIAVDHYRRMRDDVKLLRQLGVNTYRFSVAWTRLFPDGAGTINRKGLAFYKDLVRRLRDEGIRPALTLFHWDTPQKLQDTGGWTNRATAEAYEQYARTLFHELGDEVDLWTTFNEPWVTAFMGHYYGTYPPGVRDFSAALQCVHTILLAHGRAVGAHREMKLRGPIGITLDLQYAYPASDSADDEATAERENRFHLGIFADPIWKGAYPADVMTFFRERGVVLPTIAEHDFETIHRPPDFLGLNYYYSCRKANNPGKHWPLETKQVPTPATPGVPGDPQGLYDLLRWADRLYGAKLIITENGTNGRDDKPDARDAVDDDHRIRYLYHHLRAARRALADGVNLAGYIHWTFMDNFEWGDWSRMGLVHTDFETQKRTLKKSARWFHEGIATGFTPPPAA